jgi:hypothetical protein
MQIECTRIWTHLNILITFTIMTLSPPNILNQSHLGTVADSRAEHSLIAAQSHPTTSLSPHNPHARVLVCSSDTNAVLIRRDAIGSTCHHEKLRLRSQAQAAENGTSTAHHAHAYAHEPRAGVVFTPPTTLSTHHLSKEDFAQKL